MTIQLDAERLESMGTRAQRAGIDLEVIAHSLRVNGLPQLGTQVGLAARAALDASEALKAQAQLLQHPYGPKA